jgi:hypothetical protein
MKKIYLILVIFLLLISVRQALPQTDVDTTGLTPLLDWPDIPGAIYYQLQISTSPLYTIIVLDVSYLTQSQYQVQPGVLVCFTHYYWHYRGYSTGGAGSWSANRDFITTCPTGLGEPGKTPDSYALFQNYPNPFNPVTKIKFDILLSGYTTIKVYDVLGKEVANLINHEIEVGRYEISFDAAGLASGIYYYKLESGEYTSVKKMVLLK